MRRVAIAVFMLAAIACSGGDEGAIVPNPLAPGETLNVTLCGSTTEPRNPCSNFPDNSIEIRVNPADGSQQCPCFNFSFLNQNLTDLGRAIRQLRVHGGSAPGDLHRHRADSTRAVGRPLHAPNTSTSAIGVVPASLQSLVSPMMTFGRSCRLEYNTGSSQNRTPAAISSSSPWPPLRAAEAVDG